MFTIFLALVTIWDRHGRLFEEIGLSMISQVLSLEWDRDGEVRTTERSWEIGIKRKKVS